MTASLQFNSTFGWIETHASEKGLMALKLIQSPENESLSTQNSLLQETKKQFLAYCEGKLKGFDLPFDWEGTTDFYQSVWKELLKIPYGKTTTYSAIAELLGNPTASRAVGMANGRNPIAIIVPCHRVIAKSGHLQGFAHGLEMKRQLLLHEAGHGGKEGLLF
jgi:methylated-DNA-[protein]-cysteine S-methyltransferase